MQGLELLGSEIEWSCKEKHGSRYIGFCGDVKYLFVYYSEKVRIAVLYRGECVGGCVPGMGIKVIDVCKVVGCRSYYDFVLDVVKMDCQVVSGDEV